MSEPLTVDVDAEALEHHVELGIRASRKLSGKEREDFQASLEALAVAATRSRFRDRLSSAEAAGPTDKLQEKRLSSNGGDT